MRNFRLYYIYAAIIFVGLIYIYRLFQVQVIDDKYALIAEKISLRKQTVYPQRGLIFDRNDKLLVYNDPVYDLMVSVPIKLKGIDTLAFCQLLAIDNEKFDELLSRAKRRSYRGKSVFKKNISNVTYARIQERLYEFKGFFFEIRQDRNYKFNSSAHLLGYLGEVTKKDLSLQKEGYYEQGDFTGKKGVELTGVRQCSIGFETNRNSFLLLQAWFDTIANNLPSAKEAADIQSVVKLRKEKRNFRRI